MSQGQLMNWNHVLTIHNRRLRLVYRLLADCCSQNPSLCHYAQSTIQNTHKLLHWIFSHLVLFHSLLNTLSEWLTMTRSRVATIQILWLTLAHRCLNNVYKICNAFGHYSLSTTQPLLHPTDRHSLKFLNIFIKKTNSNATKCMNRTFHRLDKVLGR